MGIHFATAISATGIHQGLGTEVFLAGTASNPWQSGLDADLLMGLVFMVSWIFWREKFAFAPTMGYIGGLGCFAVVLLRIAYVGRRALERCLY